MEIVLNSNLRWEVRNCIVIIGGINTMVKILPQDPVFNDNIGEKKVYDYLKTNLNRGRSVTIIMILSQMNLILYYGSKPRYINFRGKILEI